MENTLDLNAIGVMDVLPVVVAFALGFLARLIKLPPLVGFLAAGFLLGAFGMQSSVGLRQIADVGVTLLLFTIGLKLNLRLLLAPYIWGVSSIHMLITTLLGFGAIKLLTYSGLAAFSDLSFNAIFLIAFALSFSSTVFAVKVFEESGEMESMHGRVAVGVLIMQDLFAVAFMTITSGKIPSPYALLLLLLIPLRPLFLKLLQKAGHGEMLVLMGWLIPLGGSALFEVVGIKADLGALLIGVLLAGHPKSDELSKSLYGFKDLFLIGFFLTIGLTGQPDLHWIGVSLLLLLLVPIKTLLFFGLFSMFRMRARSSSLASLGLANFSEFGLILIAMGYSYQLLPADWLAGMAIALAFSFVIAAPFNRFGKEIYRKWHDFLIQFEKKERLPEDAIIDTGCAEIVIFGMGRVGSTAYKFLEERMGDVVLGVDRDPTRAKQLCENGLKVVVGDATDMDFWSRKQVGEKLSLVILTFPDQQSNLFVAKTIRRLGLQVKIASIATYKDQVTHLEDTGVDRVFNLYEEAGLGFAEHIYKGFECEEIAKHAHTESN
jgi:predicted Kef-type K+ transport protein